MFREGVFLRKKSFIFPNVIDRSNDRATEFPSWVMIDFPFVFIFLEIGYNRAAKM